MNIAILDYTLSKTQRKWNTATFNMLKQLANLYIVNCPDYYERLDINSNVFMFNTKISQKKNSKSSFLNRISIIDNMRINSKLFKEFKDVKFDAVFIMGFEIITLSLYRFFIPKNIPIYLVQHQQIDELENRIKRFFFNKYKNKVNHIVLEEIYGKHLKEKYGVNNIHVVHHIALSEKREVSKERKFTKPLILGISSNNDENMIAEIIKEQKEKKFLNNKNVFLYLRSKKYVYEDEFLKIGYSFLTPEEYEELYNEAVAIIAVVPSTFHDRISGPVMDAIANGKVVFTSNENVISIFGERAPSMFRYFENMEEFSDILNEKEWKVKASELENIQKIHGSENILKDYSLFLNKE